jgi:hypothetical protein
MVPPLRNVTPRVSGARIPRLRIDARCELLGRRDVTVKLLEDSGDTLNCLDGHVLSVIRRGLCLQAVTASEVRRAVGYYISRYCIPLSG